MSNTPSSPSPDTPTASAPWYQSMTRYHWFVFIVCSLGWGLDCFDQQIFNVMRNASLGSLMGKAETAPEVLAMGTYATSLMLLGWAVGGILFGVMGDKYGRAKTMIITILVYATFTGLCGVAVSWWDFLIYRFLTGMGVGGQFAAGVTLLAESMPDKARPKTLGLLQIVAAACNLLAASLAMTFGILQEHTGLFAGMEVWRILFLIGFLPALLAFFVMRKLEEPEAWKAAIAAGGVKKAGSISDLFKDRRWRYNVIIGMLLSTCGVIGLWGIGFFSVDLIRTAFRNVRNQEVRARGDVEKMDFEFTRMLAHSPKEFLPIALKKGISPQSLIGMNLKSNDPGAVFQLFNEKYQAELKRLTELTKKEKSSQSVDFQSVLSVLDGLNAEAVLKALDAPSKDGYRKAQTVEEKERRTTILDKSPLSTDKAEFEKLADSIADRAKKINGSVNKWGGIAAMLFNLGAIFGTWGITVVAEMFGRRIAFTLFFAASFVMTIVVFMTLRTPVQVFWMQPVLGFCVLSIFGGYAIYFPELFPTRLRSTAVSFCYNIGRFIAATGPAGLGILTHYVFYDAAEPLRYAGATMAVTFIFGIIITWFGPETKGKPLPEE